MKLWVTIFVDAKSYFQRAFWSQRVFYWWVDNLLTLKLPKPCLKSGGASVSGNSGRSGSRRVSAGRSLLFRHLRDE